MPRSAFFVISAPKSTRCLLAASGPWRAMFPLLLLAASLLKQECFSVIWFRLVVGNMSPDLFPFELSLRLFLLFCYICWTGFEIICLDFTDVPLVASYQTRNKKIFKGVFLKSFLRSYLFIVLVRALLF